MEHTDDRHISREISLIQWPGPIEEADLKISYFRTIIVPDNEPLDEIEPFIFLSHH